MRQKETPKSPMSGGKGAEVSKTLFYKNNCQTSKSSGSWCKILVCLILIFHKKIIA